MTKKVLWNILLAGIGIAVLVYLVRRVWSSPDGHGLADVFSRPIQFGPLILAAALALVGLLITFLRWYVLVRAQHLPFRIRDALRLGAMGCCLSLALPGAISGDVVKAAFIASQQSRRSVAVATVLMDRALGLWGLIWVIALFGGGFWLFGHSAFHTQEALQWIVLGALGVVAVSLTGWLLFGLFSEERFQWVAERLKRIPKVGCSLAEFWSAVWMYRRQKVYVFGAMLMALFTHCCFAITFYFAAVSFQQVDQPAALPTLAEHFVFFPIGETIQVFFPAPGGMGGAEYGYGKLYEMVGKELNTGVIAAMFYRAVFSLMILLSGVLAFVSYMMPNSRLQPKSKEEAGKVLKNKALDPMEVKI